MPRFHRSAVAWVIPALALAVLLSGCARWSQGLTRDETRIVAWWCEDLVHGIPRRPAELDLEGGSPALKTVAAWLGGARLTGSAPGTTDATADLARPPLVLTRRMERRAVLAGFFANQWILLDETGRTGPAPGRPAAEFALAAEVADAETRDRDQFDFLLLARAQANGKQAEWWAEATREARRHWDQAEGGKRAAEVLTPPVVVPTAPIPVVPIVTTPIVPPSGQP